MNFKVGDYIINKSTNRAYKIERIDPNNFCTVTTLQTDTTHYLYINDTYFRLVTQADIERLKSDVERLEKWLEEKDSIKAGDICKHTYYSPMIIIGKDNGYVDAMDSKGAIRSYLEANMTKANKEGEKEFRENVLNEITHQESIIARLKDAIGDAK